MNHTSRCEKVREKGVTMSEQLQIESIKAKITNCDAEIKALLANFQPYMQVPKVNQEISKVVLKNEKVNSSTNVDSLEDYQRILEIKESIVSYLKKAAKVIADGIERAKQEVKKEIPSSQPSQLPENFWDEFDNPNGLTRPERKFNEDGTYTIEYIGYLAATTPGQEKVIYEQLQNYNAEIRARNINEQANEDRNEFPTGGSIKPGRQ